MERIINLYPQQFGFVTTQTNLTAFIAGIGAGKTFAGAVKALTLAKPKTVGMIVAPTYRMLRDSTERTFREVAQDVIIGERKETDTIFVRGGGEIIFRSADDPEKLRGPNLNWIWIDEGGLTRKSTWDICLGRIRADGKFGNIYVTTTPKGKRNWVYDASQQSEIFRATTFDNPHTSTEWKDMLLNSYEGQFKAQELFGEFVSFEGLVIPQFDASQHVKVMDLNKYLGFGLGGDEGYTHPAAIAKIYFDGDDNYYIEEEYYKTGKLQSEVVNEYIRMAEGVNPEVVVDSSAAGLIAAIRDAGLDVRPRTGSVLEGIKRLQELFAKGKIIINPACVNLIAELESYSWKDGKDEPVKEMDHLIDAMRYYITRKQKKQLVAKQRRY